MKKLSLLGAKTYGLALTLALAQSLTAQNFTLTLQPGSATLIPGKTTSFLVSLTPLGGFTSQVALAVSTLPSGISASFSPNPVTLPGTALLTLNAETNATLGAFTLDVSGVGGGLTNTTSSGVTVNFGLLPLCTAGFQGVVTDVETGLPVPGASVVASSAFSVGLRVITDASGQYLVTNAALAPDNLAAAYSLYSVRTDYWSSVSITAEAVCDVTNIINFQILRQRFGSISGTVTDPNGNLLPGVSVSFGLGSTLTDTNGFFQTGPLTLNFSNAPIIYSLNTSTNGYWAAFTNVTLSADSNSVVHLVIIPICTATVTGSVIYGDTGLAATNVLVQVGVNNGSGYTNTDANGNYSVPGLPLGQNNTAEFASIQVSGVPGYSFANTNAAVTNCLQIVSAPTLILPPLPRNNYGSVAGHVFDVETGLPVTNALAMVTSAQGTVTSSLTDTNGAYIITNAFVGTATTTNSPASLTVNAIGYFQNLSNFTVFAGVVVTQDMRILRIRSGEIVGIARDSATHLPIAGALITVFATFQIGPLVTHQDGSYDTGPIQLNYPNQPTFASLSASAQGYWNATTNTTLTPDTTNRVDIDLIKVCTGATIVGNVVSATTQQPITNATVSVSSFFRSTQTDSSGNFILTNITVGNDNSPIQTTVTATAPGFNPQSRTITIFCDATITTEFGVPQIVFGAIEGYVTNVLTGLPLTNAFIGSEFGASTTTDTNGYYRLDQAPLGANGSDRTWTVTAIPNGFTAQTKSVVVTSNTVSRLDFGFGAFPAFLVVAVTAAPEPVGVGSNLTYTINLRNTGADASNVQLMDAIPPTVTLVSSVISNLAGATLGAPVFSNNIVSTVAATFPSNALSVLTVTVTPQTAGTLTNIATVTSDTPDLDPTASNHTAQVTSTVFAALSLRADVGLTITATPDPVLVSNQLTYTLVVQNTGPDDAPAVVVTDSLPVNVSFISASVSQGGFIPQGPDLIWNAGALTNGGSATATLVVMPLAAGFLTNSGAVSINSALVIDDDPDNDNALAITRVDTLGVTNLSAGVSGPIVFDPQTGLFQQLVFVTNLSAAPVEAVRLFVLGLPQDVVLYNASGSTNGTPFVEYDLSLDPGASQKFFLEYYRSSREAFASTNFSAISVLAVTPTAPNGTTLQLDRDPFMYNNNLVIEFSSVPGATYVIQYSSDMQTWNTAVPAIVASGTRVQWMDAGPPKTTSPPGVPGQRFYQVIRLP